MSNGITFQDVIHYYLMQALIMQALIKKIIRSVYFSVRP